MTKLLYNSYGEPVYKVGTMTTSDINSVGLVNGFCAISAQSSTVSNYSLIPVSPTPLIVKVSNGTQSYSGSVLNDTNDITKFIARFQSVVGTPFTIRQTSLTAFTITSIYPGDILEVRYNGVAQSTNTVASNIKLKTGRFVVPDALSNVPAANGRFDNRLYYRYPIVGDSPATIAAGIFIVKDMVKSATAQIQNVQFSDPGTILPGGAFTGLRYGDLMVSPAAVITPAAVNLFVETSNGGLNGRISSVSTANNIALPAGKLTIIDTIPFLGVGRMRINY